MTEKKAAFGNNFTPEQRAAALKRAAELRAARAEVTVWDAVDVGASPEDIGQRGSRTRVVRTARPAKKAGCRMLDGFAALREALKAEEKR